jgi:hypothetical protein
VPVLMAIKGDEVDVDDVMMSTMMMTVTMNWWQWWNDDGLPEGHPLKATINASWGQLREEETRKRGNFGG